MEEEKHYAVYLEGEESPMDAFGDKTLSLDAVQNAYTQLNLSYRLKEVTAEEAKIIQKEPRRRKTSRIEDAVKLVELMNRD